MDLGESFMDNALKASKIDAIAHEQLRQGQTGMGQSTQAKKPKTVAADPEFQKTEKRIAMFLERKNRKIGLAQRSRLEERTRRRQEAK